MDFLSSKTMVSVNTVDLYVKNVCFQFNIYCFIYIKKKTETLANREKTVIDNLKIDYENYLSDTLFPTQFKVDFFTNKKNFSMRFEIIPNDVNHPVSSVDVFTLDYDQVTEHKIDPKNDEVCFY